jgi:membrane associated rhomboid family serine protease
MITREPPEPGAPPPPAPVPPPRGSLQEIFQRPASATRAVLVLVAGVSLAAFFVPGLIEALMKDNDAIQAGEVWRLLTAGLVHGGLLHLVMNGMVLNNVGGIVERLLGARRMLLVLWGGVATGSLASFLTNPHPSVGISGGVFALVGALLAVGLRHRRHLPPALRGMLVRGPVEVIILNVALGLALPLIDNAAHLGGLAGGFGLALLIGPRPELVAALGGRRAPAWTRGDGGPGDGPTRPPPWREG